jgi:photosystem II stability/assembly factor-like uncharacterized protein
MKKIILLPVMFLGAVIFFYTLTKKVNNISRTYSFKETLDSKAFAGAKGAQEYAELIYKDVITGKVELAKLAAAKDEVLQRMQLRSTGLSFIEEGPDNVGGRTRAIAIDPDNDNIMYAGSVSGGLFKTDNGGSNWSRVQEFDNTMVNSAGGVGSLGISSITFSENGNMLYIATGGSRYGENLIDGDGVWVSSDFGSSSPTFDQILGTDNKDILKVVANPNDPNGAYFVGMSVGLNKIEQGMNVIPEANTISGIPTNATIGDLKVSEDGQVMILGLDQGGIRSWISQDGGLNWTDLHSNGELSGTGTIRGEYAISKNKNDANNYTLYALFASSAGTLGGVYRSVDNGTTWYQIAPGATGNFTPLTSRSGQGNYDLVVTSRPDGEECIIGGIDLWSWVHTPNSADPENGQWYAVSAWYVDPSVPIYIHADNHRLLWKNDYTLLVGNDGGVQVRTGGSGTNQFGSVINKGYSVTQFYSMAFGGNGSVIAGAQDNGTQYKDNSQPWSKEFAEVSGGDGFECEISYLNSNAFVTTVYNGSISRSSDGGTTSQSVPAPCTGIVGENCGPFYNAIALMENPEDLNTKDSIDYVPNEDKIIGDTITYYSKSFGIPIKHVLTQNLNVYDTMNIVGTDTFVTVTGADTLTLPDYVQSCFITQNDASVYVTRDMMRYTTVPEWWKIYNKPSTSTTNSIRSFEISHDMNYAWSGSYNGSLVRITGLGNAYSKQEADISYRPLATDTLVEIATGNLITGSLVNQINFAEDGNLYTNIDGSEIAYKVHYESVSNFSGTITDISVDPSNPDNVCVVTSGTSTNHVYYSTNATSSNPSFNSIDGDLPDMPVFGCIVERDPNTDVIVIGTTYGVFSTDNIAGSSTNWISNNSEIGTIPVYDICQQWREWENPMAGGYRQVNNPGAIYACTYGRGVWRADNLLSLSKPIVQNEVSKNISSTKIYPNPVVQNANISFELNSSSPVNISIYNLNGSLVKTLYNNVRMNKGNNSSQINASELSMGTYLVVVEAGEEQEVVKFIKY